MSETPTSQAGAVRLALAFAAVYVIWGSTYLAIRFAVEAIPPYLMMGTRFLTAGLILYATLRLRGAPRPSLINCRAAAVIGGFMLLGGTGAVGWAEQWIASGLAALLVAAVPMWMVLLDWLRPGGVRPSGRVVLALAVGFGGVTLLVGPIDFSGSQRMNVLGSLAVLGGTLSWAIGSVYSRHVRLPKSPSLASALEMVMGGLLLLVAGTLMGEWRAFDPGAVPLRSALGWAYLVVFGSLIAFASYVYLLHNVAPARVGSYAYVNPVVAVLLGWALAGESIDGRTLVGAAVVVLAVALIISTRSRRSPHVAAGPGASGQGSGSGVPVGTAAPRSPPTRPSGQGSE